MPALNRARTAVTACNHFDSPLVYYCECLIAGVCFTTASSARHNDFVAGSLGAIGKLRMGMELMWVRNSPRPLN